MSEPLELGGRAGPRPRDQARRPVPWDPDPGTGSGTSERRAQVMGKDTFCDLHCIRDAVKTSDNFTLGTLGRSAQVMVPTQGPTQGL